MSLEKIDKNEKLYVRVAKEINKAILKGNYSPGEKLPPERDLASKLGVSRATIREALTMLEILGVIDIQMGKGSYVKERQQEIGIDIDIQKIKESSPFELIEARYLIESIISELAIDRANERDIKKLEKNVQFLKDNVDDDTKYMDYFKKGVEFHMLIAEATKNDILINIQKRLLDEDIHPIWKHLNQKMLNSKEARLDQIIEHETVLNAIKNKNKEEVKSAMQDHLEHLRKSLLI